MAQTRFTCTLTRADEPACQSYARVTIVDSDLSLVISLVPEICHVSGLPMVVQ